MKAILGRKVGMTQIFGEDGTVIPVTVIQAGPCVVTRKKTEESDGYKAIQVGYEDKKPNSVNRPDTGQFTKAGVTTKRFLREFPTEAVEEYEVGQEIKADVFAAGDKVDVTGTSKGKGFAGAIKRWNQSRGPMTHGSKYHRGQGSMGPASFPGRVFKTKKMPGHMGAVTRTVQNLEVVQVDPERDMLVVKGSVPGTNGAMISIKQSVKAKA